MPRILIALLVLLLPVSLSAQRMGSGHFSGHASGHFASPRSGYGHSRASAVPFWNSFYPDYFGDDSGPQPEPAAYRPPMAAREMRVPPTPLLIELEGDRYVQVSGSDVSTAQTIDRMPADSGNAGLARATAPGKTILVFSDGHRQEVSAYTITDGKLYASADYYASGAWNQTIALASLDLGQTVSANQMRGVPFRVPAAANEVIVGP
jgi:hypothetical protein